MNYIPRFRAEIYLEFLNIYCRFTFSYTDIIPSKKLLNLKIHIHSNEIEILGDSIQECLDQAIIKTNFKEYLKC